MVRTVLLSPDDLSSSDEDRYTRMHFPDHEPITFYFLGIPPGSRDAKNAESWIHPAFLALLLEADEITETVFLDGSHPFVKAPVGQDRINVDQILPCLRRLTLGYLVHLDANSRQGRGGWDYRWSDIPPLARDLAADPAFACLYLKKWQRNAGELRDALPQAVRPKAERRRCVVLPSMLSARSSTRRFAKMSPPCAGAN
jgi:CRISPR-associated protein Csc3